MATQSKPAIKLRGWPAVLVILLIAGYAGFRTLTAHRTLPTEARERLELELVSQYSRDAMADMSPDSTTAAEAEELLRLQNVEIESIDARGTPNEIVVRVSVSVDGGPPPDGKRVRYWKMRYSPVTGWTVIRRTDRLGWWLAWL